MRDSMTKFFKKFANFSVQTSVCGVNIAIRGHFSEPNILWRSEKNSLYFCCSLLLLSLILLFVRGFDRVLPRRVVAVIELEADK